MDGEEIIEISSQDTSPLIISTSTSDVLGVVEVTVPHSSPVRLPLPEPPPNLAPVLPNLAQEALERVRTLSDEEDEDVDDFKPLKRRRVEGSSVPPASDAEEQTCSICFESWSISGSHRVVSLKCGHLYGHTCIEKWLRSSGGEKCPQCNTKAKRSDIRPVFARTIAAVDTSERDYALKQLEAEKQLRIQAQRNEAQALLQQNLARTECDRLRAEVSAVRKDINVLRQQLAMSSSDGSLCGGGRLGPAGGGTREMVADGEGVIYLAGGGEKGKYGHLKSIVVSKMGNARVLAFEPELCMVGVSKPSDNNLAPGHGVLKLSMVDFSSKEFFCIHPSPAVIRDMKFRPGGRGLLLTTATDKSSKLANLQSNSVVQTFALSAPGWACAWDKDEPVYFYCGLQSGGMEVFDLRMPSQRLHSQPAWHDGTNSCPVTSLASIGRDFNSRLNCGGLLVGTLGGCTFLEKSSSNSTFKSHPLPSLPEGPCPSVTFESSTRHCLASFRPTRRSPEGKHVLFQMQNFPTDRPLTCSPVQEFPGGPTYRLLSRSRLFLRPGASDQLLAAHCHESSKTVHVWDVASTSKLQELGLGGEPALDVLPFGSSEEQLEYLGLLTQRTLHIHQWH